MKVGDVSLLVETSPGAAAPALAPRVDAPVSQLENAFTNAQNAIAAIASSTVNAIRNAAESAAHPDEVQVMFGLSFSAEGDVIVAGASGSATLQVTLIYHKALSKPDGQAAQASAQAPGSPASPPAPGT
jgi:Trypsin-co-occurring domain 1